LLFNKGGEMIKFNPPAFSEILGCRTEDDDFVHLGALFVRLTACGKPLGDMFLSDITITCPDCEAEIKHRAANPDARKKKFGVVTHKETN